MPDPAVELARSRTTLSPSDSSASGFRRIIEVPESTSRKRKGKRVGFFTRDKEYPVQAGGPSLESYYPQPTVEQPYDPAQYSLGASDPIYSAEPERHLGWLERHNIEKYEKQRRKAEERKLREAERQRYEQEKWRAKEDRRVMKENEKQTRLYRKASTHSPWNPFKSPIHTHYPPNPPPDPHQPDTQTITPYYEYNQDNNRRGFWGSLFSPAWDDHPHPSKQQKKQTQKLSKRTPESAWTQVYPYTPPHSGRSELYTGLGLPLAGETVVVGRPGQAEGYMGLGYGRPGLGIDGRVLSRTMTHALMDMDQDAYLRTGRRGYII